MSIYILCALVLIAAVPLAWLVKREGERSWQRHQQMVAEARKREAFRRMSKSLIDFQIVLRDHMTPALKKAAAEVNRLAIALREDVPK